MKHNEKAKLTILSLCPLSIGGGKARPVSFMKETELRTGRSIEGSIAEKWRGDWNQVRKGTQNI